MGVTNAAASARGKIAPDAIAAEILAGGGIFGAYFAPVTFKFFGNKLCKAGECALPHLHTGDADGDCFVGSNHDPRV